MQTAENTLTPDEQYILRAISTLPDPKISQRARLVLQWAIDPAPDRIAAVIGLSLAQTQRWLRAFSQARLNVFSADTLWLARRGLSGALTVKQLCKQYKVDLAHANQVAKLSLQLFDQTTAVHQLPVERRRLLETAAILHNVGMSINVAQHHVVGRDTLIKYTLKGFTDLERDSLACLVLFHRQRVRPDRDRLFATFSPENQRETLILAALLRVADGLDFAADQLTHIQSIEVQPDRIDVQLEGPSAAIGAARALHKVDLWITLFKQPFHFLIGGQPIESAARPRVRRFGLRPNDLMSEAARTIMAQHFQRVRELETSANDGDEEAIHDLRVAVRRLRITLRLTKSEYKLKPIARQRAALSELADRLGAVRDLDVILERSLTFAREREVKLDGWLDHLKLLRAAAQRELQRWLQSKRHQKFEMEYETFITTPDAAIRSARNRGEARRVNEMMPALIWKQYGAVRAYELIRPLTLAKMHELRIEAKRLRDGLEFFGELLGPAAGDLVEPLVRMQDHLGALQDATVMARLLKEFLIEQPLAAGALAYQVAIEKEIKTRQTQFPEMWQPIRQKSFRKLLARLLSEV